MHHGPGLCLLLCVGLTGCAAAPSEGPASPLKGADPSGPTLLGMTAEASPPDQDREDGIASPTAPAPRDRTGSPWIDCYRTFQPSDDPAADLTRLTAACGARNGMVAVTPVHAGSQGQDDPPERLAFRAHKKRCYRAFAVGAPSVIDLDITLKDAQGTLLTGDISRDRWPVVPPRGPLCAPKSERYTIEIGVAEGSGEYFFQIWGSAEEEEDEGEARTD